MGCLVNYLNTETLCKEQLKRIFVVGEMGVIVNLIVFV